MTDEATPPARWRTGIAARLALGFGVIALVLLAGNWYAARSAKFAIDTLHDTTVERIPFARTAAGITDQLLAYDRAVLDQLRANDAATRGATTLAEQHLATAVTDYVAQRPGDSARGDRLLEELRTHVDLGSRLTEAALERETALTRYAQVLDALAKRVSTTWDANARLEVAGSARRSFAELELAAGNLRTAFNGYLINGSTASATRVRRAQKAIRDTLDAHRAELSGSPGRAWVDLMDEDLAAVGRLLSEVAARDGQIDAIRAEFTASGAAVPARLNERIAIPASAAVVDSAGAAAQATHEARQAYLNITLVVIALTLAVSFLATLSVTAPVRRLIRATRSLARGAWRTRAPRGGPRELDELAGAFNSMAAQLAQANETVAQHQLELEDRVRARTRKLSFLAHHDALTTLPNRRYGFTHLRRLARRALAQGEAVGMLALDVDNFKSINDHLGHSLGDELLRAIADRLRTAAGERNFAARLGGDEFIVLVEHPESLAQLEELAANIVAAFRRPLAVADRELLVSVSVGVSALPLHAGDAASLARAADAALFRAKTEGRNRVGVFTPELLAGTASRFRMEQALRRAIEARALVLEFQPQVALEGGETTAVEALVRWRRGDGSLVPAAEFIAIAEQSGLIIALGDWVLEKAVATAEEWRAAGIARPRIAINVSMPQLLDRHFVERAGQLLARRNLPPDTLELELTETAFQTGAATIEALQRARELGLPIALDDFGTGYSSLNSLSHLPLKRVKLDRSLIADLDTNMRSAAIARAIISVCHSLGLEVTVEGIERVEQLRLLARCGPIAAQGHLVSRPIAGEAIPAFARGSRAHLNTLLAQVVRDGEREAVVPFRPRT
jgi:diguanylate cyclase (GGDEF)-like protein